MCLGQIDPDFGEGGIPVSEQAAGSAERLTAAHRALKADPSIQFNLPPAAQPPQTPEWLRHFLEWLGKVLKPVGRFFKWLASFLPDAPYAQIFFWTVIALVVAAFAWMLFEYFRYGEWRWPWRRRTVVEVEPEADEEWAPDFAPASSWLDEADALAAQGRFAEAVHHLLFRSIEDISRRRPQLVRPALTSREIAAADAVPGRARELFTSIARLVERSLFGGRPVGEPDWSQARSAYADFALPKAWKA